jgi:hypothetical protein
MDGINITPDTSKKILSFEEFCAANLGGMNQNQPGANQAPEAMPGSEPVPADMQLTEPDQTDLTLMDEPAEGNPEKSTEEPEGTEAEKPAEDTK